jgi:hypothetical protein
MSFVWWLLLAPLLVVEVQTQGRWVPVDAAVLPAAAEREIRHPSIRAPSF